MEKEKLNIEVSIDVFLSNELPHDIVGLYTRALSELDNAYAPYSKFKVAAAVLLENGEIVTGTNQENAAYPAGLCAEATAMSTCASLYPNVVPKAIFITVSSEHELGSKIFAPCGVCRQRLLEIEDRYHSDLAIWMGVPGQKIYRSVSVKNIMPLSFTSKELGK